ncbi:MAG: Spy/CpxP family protein refolding chaperone [Betaproteobacteria bacterium]|nr:Spy/CpxP family protein refolding chaperone [Betaproteobacteria bacterium]
MNRFAIAILKPLLLAALLLSTAVEAQFPPGGGGGRQRGGEGPGKSRPERAPDSTPAVRTSPASDPIAAIHRELPSLRIDMKITGEQVAAWNAFAATVRQINDIVQTRIRRESAARSSDAEPVPIPAFIDILIDEESRRLDAMRELKARVGALTETLNPEQRRMFDRRIAQSQREPLGN